MSKICPACGSTAMPRRPRISTSRWCRIRRSRTFSATSSTVPSGKAGTVLVVEFTVAGQPLHGAQRRHEAWNTPMRCRSMIDCDDQAEVDQRLECDSWPMAARSEQCGWIRDRYGVSWQIVPNVMIEFLGGSDKAARRSARCRP